MNLAVTTSGEGADLVLLHGWGMNRAVWQPLLERLGDAFRLHLIELPGHGGSAAPPAGATLDDWTRACLDAAPREAVWVGWSLGGLIALHAAGLAPERVARLGLIATNPCFVQRPDWPYAMATATFQQFHAALLVDPVATLKRFLALQVRGAHDARSLLRGLNAAVDTRPAASAVGLEQGLQLLQQSDLRTAAGRLGCPVDWILGGRDTLVPVAVSQALGALTSRLTVHVIDAAAHAPLLSDPDCVLNLLGLREVTSVD